MQAEKDKYTDRIERISQYVSVNFPHGFRHKVNPQTKRSVFEAISVGVWKAMSEGNLKDNLNKEDVEKILASQEFKQYTHVANMLHQKAKLGGRVNVIYNMVVKD